MEKDIEGRCAAGGNPGPDLCPPDLALIRILLNVSGRQLGEISKEILSLNMNLITGNLL